MNDYRSSTETLISTLRILSMEIHSEDGTANTTIAEAADRLDELHGFYQSMQPRPIETAPKDRKPIMLCVGKYWFPAQWNGREYAPLIILDKPTHWMPVIPSPKTDWPPCKTTGKATGKHSRKQQKW